MSVGGVPSQGLGRPGAFRRPGEWGNPCGRRELQSTLYFFTSSFGRAVLIALAAAFLATDTPHAQAPKRLALVGGMLVTGYDVAPIHHAAILIEGNRIVAAGPSSDVRITADATVIDTSGRTMMPGLIETHGHLVVLGHGAYETWFPWITSHGGEQMLTRVMEKAMCGTRSRRASTC